jgi:mannose-6-phosphate isomerase-like protein (cupin superfamily)
MSQQPVILSPSEGEKFSVGELTITTRIVGSQTGGTFELYDLVLGPFTIDYHVHETMDETLSVLEGEIEFVIAGEKYSRPAGSVVFIPRGVHHGFTNRGPARARVFAMFTPSGNQNDYFRQLEKLFSTPSLDKAALQALQKQYDQVLIPEGR